jgi:hypothetical protein
LVITGLVSLDAQAEALGLLRSTATSQPTISALAFPQDHLQNVGLPTVAVVVRE